VTLNGRSIANLAGVHPDLVRVVLRAAAAGARFIVTEGVRSSDRQAMLVSAGKSRTLRSRHLAVGDPPLGHAVDLAVVIGEDEVSWRREDYHLLNVSIQAAATELGIPLRWGGNFGGGFFDGPHWELPRTFYPEPPVDFSKSEPTEVA
jgi:peptidoglycan L-alanyl-D-glutamate endopeptidase CwlK